MRLCIMCCMLNVAAASMATAEGEPWQVMYDGGFKAHGIKGWSSDLTKSERTTEGLRVVDPSTDKGSGRFYQLNWHVNPEQGATVEARLKAVSCSAPWGVCLLVADGVHEEGVTFFPDKVVLAGAKLRVPFDTASAFHTCRVQIRGEDIKVWADEKMLLDGAGKFTTAAQHRRNQVGFGCGSSAATGKTWQAAPGFHVGAFQFPDGEVIQLGFSTNKTEREGYFSTRLVRSTDNGKTAKSETTVIHIPEGTGGTGDNGKPFEGPVADHAIVQLRDGSLLAAMYGQFKTDRVLIPTMPVEWQCFKYRTFVVRSTDRGKTWEYLATVAYDPSVGLESFCEADLLTLPGGDILCFMNSVEEVASDTLLVVYDCQRLDETGNLARAVEGVYVTVKRTK